MNLPLPNTAKFYFNDGFYYLVSEGQLIQFTESFFNEWKPGSKLYNWKIDELERTKPISDKEGEYAYKLLCRRILEIANVFKKEFLPYHLID